MQSEVPLDKMSSTQCTKDLESTEARPTGFSRDAAGTVDNVTRKGDDEWQQCGVLTVPSAW